MSLIERDRAHLWHPYAPASPALPLWEVEDASGVTLRLKDDDGARHEVVDAMSSWWSAIHGYRHPTLDDAARRQLSRFSHVMFGGLTHEPAVELAERLVAMVRRIPRGRRSRRCSWPTPARCRSRSRSSWRCSISRPRAARGDSASAAALVRSAAGGQGARVSVGGFVRNR